MSSHAVKVAVKLRPLNSRESNQRECTVISDAPDGLKSIHLGDGKSFSYDYVIHHTESQSDFYNNCVSQLVDGLFDGYNATVLAYGQTGSGKTFSMGTSCKMEAASEETLGVVPRAARQIFQKIASLSTADGDDATDIKVETQFLELYQDTLVDLYDHKNPNPLKITLISQKGAMVASKMMPVKSAEETMENLQKAAMNRQVGGTQMNAESSRSHAVFTIHIHIKRVSKGSGSEAPQELNAKFCLVDLAGSERIGKTGAEGERKQEGIGINQGLFALGNVISALGSTKKGMRVNYRDSKLTLLLKDSLGGNSKTLMIACISPSAGEVNETKSTLEYANKARNIKNTVKVNQDESSAILSGYKERIKELEKLLRSCTCGLFTSEENKDKREKEQENEKIKEPNKEKNKEPMVQKYVNTLAVGSIETPNNPLPVEQSVTCTQDNSAENIKIVPNYEEIKILQKKNEELQASLDSSTILNTQMSHELSNWRLYSDLNELKLGVKGEPDYENSLIQKLEDINLLNGELETELERRKKYYSFLDESRKRREKLTDVENTSSSSVSTNSLIDEILVLSKQDVERRTEFYKSLPEFILRPKLKKKRKRLMLRKQSGFLRLNETCSSYNQPEDSIDISTKLLPEMTRNESLTQIIKNIKPQEVVEELPETVSQSDLIPDTPSDPKQHEIDQMTAPKTEVERVYKSVSSFTETAGKECSIPVEDKCEVVEDDFQVSSLYSESDYEGVSGGVLTMMMKKEAKHQQEQAKKRLMEKEKLRSQSENDVKEEFQGDTLYSESDYEAASGPVLTMMREMEAKHQQEQAKKRLLEKEKWKRQSKKDVREEFEGDTLYSESDYEAASGPVLTMMREMEAKHQQEQAKKRLLEKEKWKRQSKKDVREEFEGDTLYSESDYESASGPVLTMMREMEAKHQQDQAKKRLLEKDKWKRQSKKDVREEFEGDTLYSESDYESASGPVLTMMREMEAKHQQDQAKKFLSEKEKTRSQSEKDVKGDSQGSALFSESDYESASGPVLTMMREMEAKHQQKEAQKRLKEVDESKVCDITSCFGSKICAPVPREPENEMKCESSRTDESEVKEEHQIQDEANLTTQEHSESDGGVQKESGPSPASQDIGTTEPASGVGDCTVEDPINERSSVPLTNSLETEPRDHDSSNIQETCVESMNASSLQIFDPTLPEEDQARQIQGELTASKAPPVLPKGETETSDFPQFPFDIKTPFSTLRRQSSYFSSAYYYDSENSSEEIENGIPNSHVINPDVEILLNDIRMRKEQAKAIKRERDNFTRFKKQSSERIKELEEKILKTVQEKNAISSDLNAAQIKLRQADTRKIVNEYEKKITSLKSDLNDEKKKTRKIDLLMKDSQQHAMETKKLKEAFDKSEKERKKLGDKLKNSIKRTETMEKDQAVKLKNFEKKVEKDLNRQVTKNNEAEANIKKIKAEREKIDVLSKKKLDAVNKESTKLRTELKEAKAKISSMSKLQLNKQPTSVSPRKKLDIDKKTDSTPQPAPSIVRSRVRQYDEQPSKPILDVADKLLEDRFQNKTILQQITALLGVRKKESKGTEATKRPPVVSNRREKASNDPIHKTNRDKKSTDIHDCNLLRFDVRKINRDNAIENLITFVFSFKDKRAKLALGRLMAFTVNEGVDMKARIMEEDGKTLLLTEMENYSSRLENLKNMLYQQLTASTRINYPDKPLNRFRRYYSTNDFPTIGNQPSDFSLNPPKLDFKKVPSLKSKQNEKTTPINNPLLTTPRRQKMLSRSKPDLKSASVEDTTPYSSLDNSLRSIPRTRQKSAPGSTPKSPSNTSSVKPTLPPGTSHHTARGHPAISEDANHHADKSKETNPTTAQTLTPSRPVQTRKIQDKAASCDSSTVANTKHTPRPITSRAKSTSEQSSPTKVAHSLSQPKPNAPTGPKKNISPIKNSTSITTDQKFQISSLLLEEEFLITSTAERFIRFTDIETKKEKYSIPSKLIPEPIRKITFCKQDKLLHVALGKRIKIFDVRFQKPITEIKVGEQDQFFINDMATTIERNILYIAFGFDVLVWDISCNRMVGKLQGSKCKGDNCSVASMCYSIRRNKTPFLVTCNRNKSVKVFDYPESVWSKSVTSTEPHLAEKHSHREYLFNDPITIKDLAYDNNSPVAVYDGTFFLANNTTIYQWNLDSKSRKPASVVTNKCFSDNENKNLADINNMVTHPNQPILITSCRKGSVVFWDPVKPFSRNSSIAQPVFPYGKTSVSKLSCNSRMLATTNIKSQEVRLWSFDLQL